MEEIYQFSPLTMKWCVDCHRETEVIHAEDNEYYDKILAAHEQMKEGGVTVADLGGIECARCHYGLFLAIVYGKFDEKVLESVRGAIQDSRIPGIKTTGK